MQMRRRNFLMTQSNAVEMSSRKMRICTSRLMNFFRRLQPSFPVSEKVRRDVLLPSKGSRTWKEETMSVSDPLYSSISFHLTISTPLLLPLCEGQHVVSWSSSIYSSHGWFGQQAGISPSLNGGRSIVLHPDFWASFRASFRCGGLVVELSTKAYPYPLWDPINPIRGSS